MQRLLSAGLALLVAGLAVAESDRHHFTAAVDFSVIGADGELPSWLYSGNGKLRYDDDHQGLRVSRAFLDYRGRIAPTLFAHAVLNVNDTVAETIDVTEAYVEWRPLPRSEYRARGRAGFFYPRLSLENGGAGWTSPYTLSASTINTWLGEELRVFGAELRLTRDLPQWPGHQVSVEGGLFYGNDPTGALLTWRGWASHDRQTGLNGKLPLPEISAIEAWDPGGNPIGTLKPFQEIDNRPGYYASVEWSWRQRVLLRYSHYDNRADPEVRDGEDYAWETVFEHVGIQVALPWDLGLLGQWIGGSTKMGVDLGPWRVQDVDYDTTYLMLTRPFGRHRISTRYEWFDLQPFNDPLGITNQDKGNAMAVAWLWAPLRQLQVGAEYLQIASEHCRSETCFWVFQGLPRSTRDQQLQLTMRWYFQGTAPGYR